MARLAIQGHSRRGKEVIQLLEMLGGENSRGYLGNSIDCHYYIDDQGIIECKSMDTFLFTTFNITIEDFLRWFPYKVWDKVIIKNDLQCSDLEGENDIYTVKSMVWNTEIDKVAYQIEAVDGVIDDNFWFANEMVFAYEKETMKKKKETMKKKKETIETMEGVYAYNEINCYHQDFGEKVRIRLGNQYEIKVEGDITYIVKKQPQYPKTYKECCGIVNANPHIRLTYDLSDGQNYSYDADNLQVYESIRKLLICRDAYWKIAGEQMGLGQPWNPDWSSCEDKFCITIFKNKQTFDDSQYISRILAFPTPEIRNEFKENFDKDIENCKKLL